MNYTSAQANKLLKKLNDEYTALLDKETGRGGSSWSGLHETAMSRVP